MRFWWAAATVVLLFSVCSNDFKYLVHPQTLRSPTAVSPPPPPPPPSLHLQRTRPKLDILDVKSVKKAKTSAEAAAASNSKAVTVSLINTCIDCKGVHWRSYICVFVFPCDAHNLQTLSSHTITLERSLPVH